jgi:hypothetical protein
MASSLVTVDMFSFSDFRRPGSLAGIGRAFDADPALRPERMDTRDPIRTRIDSAEAYLAGIEPTRPRPGLIGFQRRATIEYVGDVDTKAEPAADRQNPRRLWFSTGALEWIEDPRHAKAFAALAFRLAGAFDAAYGFATHSKMPWQQRMEFIDAKRRGETAPPEPGPFTDRHSLRDVYWLNIFGPAFVERFGDRLETIGIRHERTDNGGIVVWAAETPFLYDESMASHRDYPWKQEFYDALGTDAFVHVGQASTGLVPGPADHRRLARREG